MTAPDDDARHLLVASLGASWAVVPEVLGWLAPALLDLYAKHPEAAQLAAERHTYGLQAPNEIWLLTTEGAAAERSIAQLCDWYRRLGAERAEPPPVLRIWQAAGTDALASAEECRRLRELAFRAVLAAHEKAGARGSVTLSLAGGRKTMSADLQDAGEAFGRSALLHVVGDDRALRDSGLHDPSAEALLTTLSERQAAALRPLVVAGRSAGEPALQITKDVEPINAATYPLPSAVQPEPGTRAPIVARWQPDRRSLADLVARRRAEAQRLLVAQALALTRDEPHEPWPVLLRLNPARIESLRRAPPMTGAADPLADPSRWPLADLHRHLGGAIDLAGQRGVAAAVLTATPRADRERAERALATVWPGWQRLDTEGLGDDWPGRLRQAVRAVVTESASPPCHVRAVISSLLLSAAREEALTTLLWPPELERVALKTRHPLGFAAYERPGELSGSALLGHPAAIAPYAQAVVAGARREGLLYLELRGSPHKYRPDAPVDFVRDLEHALAAAGACTGTFTGGQAPRISFIWIIDRRQRESAAEVVKMAVEARRALPEFVVGLDLAGDEATAEPDKLAPSFVPAHEACMRITIHAGEGEPADSIWKAAYHLHADRIGHGLTLTEHADLTARFRDRGIALELCPTSNREVVGFRDPSLAATADLPIYPLGRMIDAGLPITINTDNPAISRCRLADEYITAARMCPTLTAWRALGLLRLAFRHAFVGAAERSTLEAEAARRLLELATSGHGPTCLA